MSTILCPLQSAVHCPVCCPLPAVLCPSCKMWPWIVHPFRWPLCSVAECSWLHRSHYFKYESSSRLVCFPISASMWRHALYVTSTRRLAMPFLGVFFFCNIFSSYLIYYLFTLLCCILISWVCRRWERRGGQCGLQDQLSFFFMWLYLMFI